MCSRVCLSTNIAEIKRRFGVIGGVPQLRPHWNIAPGQVLPVIRWDTRWKWRCLELMRWGLIPAWAKNSIIVQSNLNIYLPECEPGNLAQAAPRRCLVPIDNFYEWRIGDKQPFAVALADRQIMALAGLWDEWISPSGERIACFAILTIDANDLLSPLCQRMPVIVFPQHWDLWLGEGPSGASEISALLTPCADESLTVWPIDRRVGNAKNDDPDILAAIAT
jgi:putative SOS response-associated peptidase YedK